MAELLPAHRTSARTSELPGIFMSATRPTGFADCQGRSHQSPGVVHSPGIPSHRPHHGSLPGCMGFKALTGAHIVDVYKANVKHGFMKRE
jgi:hypothetical protein